jgi:hypothetical protein
MTELTLAEYQAVCRHDLYTFTNHCFADLLGGASCLALPKTIGRIFPRQIHAIGRIRGVVPEPDEVLQPPEQASLRSDHPWCQSKKTGAHRMLSNYLLSFAPASTRARRAAVGTVDGETARREMEAPNLTPSMLSEQAPRRAEQYVLVVRSTIIEWRATAGRRSDEKNNLSLIPS